MPVPKAIVVIPTLEAGKHLEECVSSLRRQTWRDFETVVVDNGGQGLVRRLLESENFVQAGERQRLRIRVIENTRNVGYGEAINQAVAASDSSYVAVLNDDATVCPEWLGSLIGAMEEDSGVGMCASRVILAGEGLMDSAGMLLCPDGSSKQRGHGRPMEEWNSAGDCLLPSGSAALYRRKMIEETGGFDARFFLYCEDTDLGLRAIWAGWRCRYVPQAQVLHHYSKTAGGVSKLKAYYVERNRWLLVWKTFPLGMLWSVPVSTLSRYFWHLMSLGGGSSAASKYSRQGNSWLDFVFIPVRAFAASLALLGHALKERARIRGNARISAAEFARICKAYAISPKEVARL